MTLRFSPQRTAASSAKTIDSMSRFRYGQVQRRPRRKFFIRSRPVLGNGPGPAPADGQTAEMYLISAEGDKAGWRCKPVLVKKCGFGYSARQARPAAAIGRMTNVPQEC